jgi:hypothetical protein
MEQWCIAQLLGRLQSNLFNDDERRILNFPIHHYKNDRLDDDAIWLHKGN